MTTNWAGEWAWAKNPTSKFPQKISRRDLTLVPSWVRRATHSEASFSPYFSRRLTTPLTFRSKSKWASELVSEWVSAKWNGCTCWPVRSHLAHFGSGPSAPFLSFSFSRQCTDTTQCALIAGNKSIDIISPIGNGQREMGMPPLFLSFLFVDQKSSTVLSMEGEKERGQEHH